MNGFMNDKTEAQKGQETCLRSGSQEFAEPGFEWTPQTGPGICTQERLPCALDSKLSRGTNGASCVACCLRPGALIQEGSPDPKASSIPLSGISQTSAEGVLPAQGCLITVSYLVLLIPFKRLLLGLTHAS